MLKQTTEFSFLGDNYVYDLRNLGASDYLQEGTVPHLIEMCKGNTNTQETAMAITDSWMAITELYGLEEQRRFYRNALGLPEYIRPPTRKNNVEQLRKVIVGVTVPFAIIAIILTLVVLKQRHTIKFHTREIMNAPTTGTIVLLFTDIEGSTNLWDTDKEVMQRALAVHHNVIRTCIDKYSAYEVKTIGDAFMIAIDSADRAVLLANDIQLALLDADWPLGLLRMPSSCVAYYPKPPERTNQRHVPRLMFSGLRVRIGIHLGQKSNDLRKSAKNVGIHLEVSSGSDVKNSTSIGIHFGQKAAPRVVDSASSNSAITSNSNSEIQVLYDHVTKGFDYYGQVVNATARIEGIGFGGQTIISDQVYSQISEQVRMKCAFIHIGAMRLRGIADEITVYSCLPEELRGRQFSGIFRRIDSADESMCTGMDQFGRTSMAGTDGSISIPSRAPKDLDVMSLSPIELQRELTRTIQLACIYEEQLATYKMMDGTAIDEISFDGVEIETVEEFEKHTGNSTSTGTGTGMLHVNLEDGDLSEDGADEIISIKIGVDEEVLVVADEQNAGVSKPFVIGE